VLHIGPDFVRVGVDSHLRCDRIVIDKFRTTDRVKITYLPTLQHFTLAARKRHHYHDPVSSLEKAAPPAAWKLHDPEFTTNRNLVLA
jgi:hypothetical protein